MLDCIAGIVCFISAFLCITEGIACFPRGPFVLLICAACPWSICGLYYLTGTNLGNENKG